MSGETGPDAEAAFDAISRRSTVIECLVDGPKYNRDIRDELDVSRSTAYKAVAELEELDLARRGDDGYELTLLGQLIFAQYRQCYDQITDICRPGGLLALLPRDIDLPYEFFTDAEITRSERHAPNQPVREVERVVEEASTVKGTGPVVLPRYVELFSDQVLSDELDAALVFEHPAFDHLATVYEEDIQEAVQSENLDVWVTDSELPYGLLVVEEPVTSAGIIVYDDAGDIKGFVTNDTDAAYDWGRSQWERYRTDAVEPPTDAIE